MVARRESAIAGGPLEPWGELWCLDGAGYLINPCDRAHLRGPWGALVAAWVAALGAALGDRAVGFYVRGSIPRGRAIDHLSDLDGIVVIAAGERPDDGPRCAHLNRRLRDRYPFCRAVETSLVSLEELFDPAYAWGALLKTQGLWVAGDNAMDALPPVKPGPALWLHRPTLHRDWRRTAARLRQSMVPSHVKSNGAWFNRRLVRAGFELVMAREGTYTRDLYPCYEAFARHYRDRAPAMALAARLAIAPSTHRAGLLAFWQEFVPWLVEQIDRDTEWPMAE